MLRIDRYIFKTTLLFTLFSLILLSIIETLFTALNEMQMLTEEYTLSDMGLFLFYDAPARLYRIFPMSLLLGCLVGLGELSSNNELTAIRTSGFSKVRTIYGAIIAVLLLSAGNVLLGEYLIPYTAAEAKTAQKKEVTTPGFWAISQEYTIEVTNLEPDRLLGINLYKVKEQELTHIIKAKEALLKSEAWIIPSAEETTVTDQYIKQELQEEIELPILIDKNALTALTATPEELPLTKLKHFIGYLDNNGLDSGEYRLAFWSKLFNPLTNLAMLLIASPLIFAQQRQQGIGARILIGIVLGLIIYLVTEMLGHFILISGYPPIVGALFPTILAVTIALILFKLLPN